MNDWMNKLPNNIKQRKINNILLPGSHDSCAYKLDLSVSITEPTLESVRKHGKWFLSSLLNKWTLTQNYDIYNQLLLGIRYLDVRISELGDKFYTSHTFACVEFNDILNQINNFSTLNPSEIIIIDLSRDSKNSSSYKNANKLSKIILDHEITRLCFKVQNDEIPTYEAMINNKTPIIFLVDNSLELNDISKLSYAKRFKNWTNSQTNCDNTIRSLVNIARICDNNDNYITILEETLTATNDIVIRSFIMHITFFLIHLVSPIIILSLLFKGSDGKKIITTIILIIMLLAIMNIIFVNTHDSIYSMSLPVRGSLIKVFNENENLKNYISVISGDFIDKNFCQSVYDLNIKE